MEGHRGVSAHVENVFANPALLEVIAPAPRPTQPASRPTENFATATAPANAELAGTILCTLADRCTLASWGEQSRDI